jgi:hypothetical protein
MPRLRIFMLALAIAGCGSSQAAPTEGHGAASQSPPAASPASPTPSAEGTPCVARAMPNEPRPASSVEVHLPKVPKLEKNPTKVGDAYSVWGASYFLRSRVHRKEVEGKTIVVEGYVVKTNLLEAPRCAVHRGGRADPENCRSPVPAFWIGDTPNSAPSASIKVLGWASNYAQIYDAIREFDAGKPEYTDVLRGVRVPNPLPATGAKVRVSGVYDRTFAAVVSITEMDPHMGLITYGQMSTLEPAPELATLPGVRRTKPR